MSAMEWSASLSVGFEPIDGDHKKLIALINRLDTALKEGDSVDEVTAILEELVSYTTWHFRHEERLMQEHGYPGYFKHKQEHDKLAATVKQQQQRFENGEFAVGDELMRFLTAWLTNHILGTDKETGQFLARHDG